VPTLDVLSRVYFDSTCTSRYISQPLLSGNWGVQDQRASMEWVQQHAAAFGGDPNRITIFGESAGAGSVAFHLVAPRSYDHTSEGSSAAPLFRAAMMESGNLATPWNSQNMSYAEKKLTAVAVNLGCLPEGSVGPVSDNATVRYDCVGNSTAA